VTRLEQIRARQAEIATRQAAIQAELVRVEGLAEPTEADGDEAARAQILADRSVTVDEAANEFDTLVAERAELETEAVPLQERSDRLDRVRSAAVQPTNRERGAYQAPNVNVNRSEFSDLEAVRSGIVPGDDMRARALTAIENAPKHLNDAGREHITRVIDEGGRQAELIARHMLLTGSPEYHEDFTEYIASRGQYMGPHLRAALALSPDTAGGALVPFTLDPTIILTNAGIVDPIRAHATVMQIATDSWNGVTSAGVTAQYLDENTAADDATPTVAPKAIPVYKAFAWVRGSYEILGDSNFASQLPRLLADAKSRLEGARFATGSGSGAPTGVVTAAVANTGSRVALAAGTAITAADVFNISNAASPRYAANSVWLANKSAFNQIRQFSTVTSGGAFWTDMGTGIPNQLLGADTYEASSMDKMATGTTSTLLALGDLSMYYVIERVGMTMLYNNMVMDTTSGSPLGQAGWSAWWRNGGDLTDPGAVRVFRQFTTTSGWV